VKYGITLDQSTAQDYLATDGSTIWDATANSTYKNNITGIGRDDAEALNQKQSRSINSGFQPIVGLGSIATDNASNINTFNADKSYLIWGDNGNTIALTTALSGKAGVNNRMARVWKVQESGTVGSVQIAIPRDSLPSTISAAYLVVSDDATFDGTDQFIPLTQGSLNGINSYTASVDFTTGQYFSFAAYVVAPGGVVSNLNLWVKANSGVAQTGSNVTDWLDQTGKNSFTINGTAPTYPPAYVNFNPLVRFAGAGKLVGNTSLSMSEIFSINAWTGAAGTSRGAILSPTTNASNGASRYFLWSASVLYTGIGDASINYMSVTPPANDFNLWNAAGPNIYRRNGLSLSGGTTGASMVGIPQIGNRSTNDAAMNGDIAEIVLYGATNNATDRNKVESYLAVKYGITLDQATPQNYLATDGSTIWDATANSAYKNNIAGIGRDDAEALNQKQSRSINNGAIVTIGLGSIAADNASNSSSFENDKSYLIWGSNSTALTSGGANLPLGTCIGERLTQQWKVQFTNFNNSTAPVDLNFDLTGVTQTGSVLANYALLVDKTGSGNFTNLPSVDYVVIPATALNGSVVSFDDVTALTNGAVFTLITRNATTPVAKLVADNTNITVASACLDADGWLYFKDPADPDKYVAAIDPNGNTVSPADFSAYIAVDRNMGTELGKNSGTSFGTQLMRRLVTINYAGSTALNTNGGVKLRLLWDPAEQTAAQTYLSATRGVTTPQQWSWFKHSNDIAATLADLAPEQLANITKLTPSSTGTVDGVNYVQFDNIQSFSTFGGVATASNVLSVVKKADGNEEAAVSGSFTIKLPAALQATEDITVTYKIAGTATPVSDYSISGLDNTALTGTAVIPAGSNSVDVVASVVDDKMIENTENIQLTLTGATGASSGTYTISATENVAALDILDNDNTAANKIIGVVATVPLAKEAGPVNGVYTFSLPAGITCAEDITVNYTLGSGTAAYGTDYTLAGYNTSGNTGTVTIPAGQNSVTLPVVVSPDDLLENNETVILNLASPQAGSSTSFNFVTDATNNTGTVTIEDSNDPAARYLSITKVQDGYEKQPSGSTPQQAIFRIGLPTGVRAAEDITVPYAIDASGTAAYTSDYTIGGGFNSGTMSGTATIPAGQNYIDVTVNIVDDNVLETDESIIVNISDGNSGAYPANPVDATRRTSTLTIFDDDRNDPAKTQVAITATQAAAAEPGTNGQFSIGLPAGVTASADITVTLGISGTAIRGTDYGLYDAANTLISGFTVTIPAGQNSVPVNVQVQNDNIIEGDETVIASLNSAVATGIGLNVAPSPGNKATVTIDDDDDIPSRLVLSIQATQQAGEPSVNGYFTVSLPTNFTSARDITVSYTIGSGSTAVGGTDYNALSGTVTIPAGQNSATIYVNPINNYVIDGTRSVVAVLNSTAGTDGLNNYAAAASPANSATVNITDDDYNNNSNVVLLIREKDAVEGGTNGQFLIALPNGVTSATPVTMTYSLSGVATEGTDYTLVDAPYLNKTAHTITIPAGQNSVVVDVNAVNDGIIEPTETVVLNLSNAVNGNGDPFMLNPASASVNILDVNGAQQNNLVIAATTPSVNENGGVASFTVSIASGNTYTQPIAVSIAVGSASTASQGVDYQSIGTITIPAGQNSVTVNVPAIDDHIIEATEHIQVQLLGGNSIEATPRSFPVDPAAANGNTISLDIVDDDNTAANRVLEIVKTGDGAEPGTNGGYEIHLPEYAPGQRYTSAVPLTIGFAVSGTATEGTDYATIGSTVVLPANQGAVQVPLAVKNDNILEGTETATLTLNATAATADYGGTSQAFTAGASSAATANITDDEDTPANHVLSVTGGADANEAGTNSAFTISLPGGIVPAEAITVQYTIGGTAANGTDYAALSGTVVLPAGQNSVTVPVNVINDNLLEPTETVVLTLSNGSSSSFTFTPSTTNGSATINIIDDDNTPGNRVLSIVKTTDAAEPGTNGAFSVSLPSGILASENITVNYTISGTATGGADYATLSGTATIAAGTNSVTLAVNVIDDKLIEQAETVVATITGGTSASFTYTPGTPAAATVTISDDDNTADNRTLSIQKLVDGAEPSANATFRISLPAGITAAEDVTISYTIGGSAVNGTDYNTLTGTVTLPAGQNSTVVTATVIDDQVIEGTETVTLTLGNGTTPNLGTFTPSATAGNATANIADDDNIPANQVLSISNTANGVEGGANGVFTISLPAGITAAEPITIGYTVAGTATAGTDYTALTGTVVLPAGSNSVTLPVTVVDDQLIENTETVVVTLGNGTATTLGTFTPSSTNGSAAVNIADNDNIAGNRELSVVAGANAAEPGTNSNFTISLPSGITVAEDITVNYTISGTAVNGTDYAALTGTVVIPAGSNSVSVPVTVTDDQIIEGNETVVLQINSGSSGSFAFTPSATSGTATVTITDNDNTPANQVLAISKTADAAEPGTNGAFTISLPAGITAATNIQVNYSIGAGTATPGTDYRAITGTIVIPAGQNSVSVPVNVIDNTVIEPTETVIMNITGGTDGGGNSYTTATASATVNITDNDYAANSNVVLLTKVSDAIEGGTNGQYRISLQPGVTSSEDVVVNFTLGGTAANPTDYSLLGLSGGKIVIPAGANEIFIDVDAGNDGIIEGPETVVLTLTSAASASYPFTIDPSGNGATVNIVDANAASSTPLQVKAGSDAAEPASNGQFTVQLAGGTSAWPVTVGYRVSGTAVSGVDYQSIGSIVIPPNTNSVTVDLNVIDDHIIEPTETMVFTLLSGSATDGGGNAFIFPPDPLYDNVTVNIADDDATAANQVLEVAKTTDAAEPNSNGAFTVSLPTGYTSSANITLNYSLTGTATRNTDYSVFTITLPANTNSVVIPVNVTDDKIIEPTETATMNLTGGTDGNSFTYSAHSTNNTATLNIADDDNIADNRVLSVAAGANATEAGTASAFTISLPAGYTSSTDITVHYTMSGAAVNGADYNNVSGTVIIPAGQGNITVPVTAIDDNVIEGDETVVLTINNGTDGNSNPYTASGNNGSATLTIVDNDNIPGNQVISVTAGTHAAEPNTNGSFTISLPAGITTAEAVTVNYTVSGTAAAGADYTTLSGSVVIPAGQNSVTVPVEVRDDQIIENTETVVLTVTGGNSAAFAFTASTTNGNATVNISDNDNIAINRVVSVTNTGNAAEPGTNGSFAISLPAGITAVENITVNYTITGTATPGADYTALSGTAVIPAGKNSITVPVQVTDDQVLEPAETVVLTLTNTAATGFAFTPSTNSGSATVTISDDDNIPANVQLSVVRTADAAEPSANGVFTISLPGGVTVGEPVTVQYTVAGTAINGTDYANLNGTVIIPAGQNSVTVPVQVTDDQIIEPTENVQLTVTGGTSASFTFTSGSTASLDILDNDNTPGNRTLSVANMIDGTEGGSNGSFNISLPAGITAATDITVNYTITGTAGNGTDYTTLNGTAVIKAGQNSVTVPVTVTDDQIIENTETAIFTITGGTAGSDVYTASSTNGSGTVNITDNDNTTGNKTLTLAKTADAAEPATSGSFTVSLPAGITAAEDIRIDYTVSGTATNGTDYTALNGTVTIPAGQNSALIPVTVTDDQVIEGDETVIATLSNASAATLTGFTASGNATVVISDDDINLPERKTLSVTSTADAAEPGTNGAFTISLPAGVTATQDITVQYTIGGTATGGTDYTTLGGTAVIPAGQNSISIPVSVIDDKIIEGNETVVLTLTGGTSASLGAFTGTGTATVLIADDDNIDAGKTLSVTKTTDAAEPGTNSAFVISLPAGVTATEDITVTYTTGGTATNGTDYAALSGTVIIPAGQNSVSLPVSVTDDKIIEGDETLSLSVTGGSSASFGNFGGGSNATLTIADDDNTAINSTIAIAGTGMAAEPGTNGTFTFSLPAGITAAQDITVTYSVSGTATAGADYASLSGTVIIPAGQNSVTLPVTVIDDQLIENNETVIVTLGGASAGTLGSFTATGTATVTIADDDAAANVLNVTASIANAAEPSTNGAFTISLPGTAKAAGDIAVNYTISGTAKPGVDYVALSGTAVIPAGANSVVIPVQVIDNQTPDGTRTVVLSVTGGEMARVVFTPGASSRATVTISDNDVQSFDTWKTVALPSGNTTGTVHGGEQLTYTIHVRNTGNIAIPAVTVNDPVPAHTSYVSGGTFSNNTVSFTISNLAPGATAEVSFVVKADANLGGVRGISNTAQVSDGLQTKPTGSCDPSAPGCNAQPGTVIGVAAGDLIISKRVVEPFAPPYRMGMDITYRITVTNRGDVGFSNVTVKDTLPASLQVPKSITTAKGQVDVDPNTRVITWTPGTMDANEELHLDFVCRVIEGGQLSNTAIVTAAEPETDTLNNRAVSVITVEGLNLFFPNTITPNGDGKNEKFIIGGLEKYPGSSISIFNRWGSEVYRSSDYRNDWTGGNLVSGVYFYVLQVKTSEGNKVFKGWIQILK
jgi:gliding motility-associated-like protein